MAGPSRCARQDSKTDSKEDTRKEIIVEYSDWLNELTAENSRKYGVPLDYAVKQIRQYENDPEADPYRYCRPSLDQGEDVEIAEGWDDRSQARRADKVIGRKDMESPRAGARKSPNDLLTPISISSSSIGSNVGTPVEQPSTSPFASREASGEEPSVTYVSLDLPAWYTKIKTTDRGMKELGKRPSPPQTQAMKALSSMKSCMDRCETTVSAQLPRLFEELRDQVHKAEITLKVDRFIVRRAKMLDTAYGLPRMFISSSMVDYPWDIKTDAWQLYRRWHGEIFEIDLLRGIKARKGRDRNADRIDPSWIGRFPAKFYGEGHLVLGQWWPTQLCAVRDGAHGAAQGGIYGEKELGAYSVVLSGMGNSLYDDEDSGDEIWYSGTDGKDHTVTENTTRLIESCDTIFNKVRVLRSHQLHKSNAYRPVVGLRYDGLYEVVEKKLVDAQKQTYKFRLVRSKDQFPIRCEDNAARRPTRFEIAEDDKLRKGGR